jgi:hypothetical protein
MTDLPETQGEREALYGSLQARIDSVRALEVGEPELANAVWLGASSIPRDARGLVGYPDREQGKRVQELAGLVFFRLEWELRFEDRSGGSDPDMASRALWVQEEQTLFPLDQSLLSAWRRFLGDEKTMGANVAYPRLRSLAEPSRLNLTWRLVYASVLSAWMEAQLQVLCVRAYVSHVCH